MFLLQCTAHVIFVCVLYDRLTLYHLLQKTFTHYIDTILLKYQAVPQKYVATRDNTITIANFSSVNYKFPACSGAIGFQKW